MRRSHEPPPSRVHLSVELTDSEAWELAQLIKRIRFDQVAALTECGQSRRGAEESWLRAAVETTAACLGGGLSRHDQI